MSILDRIIAESIDEELYNARNSVNQNATEKQKKAGNYKKGRIRINGFMIRIETPKGGVRRGKDKNGHEWSVQMPHDYGYFSKTRGHDNDQIDVFIGDDLESENIYVVDQKVRGKFDESKVMFCFDSIEKAKQGYLDSYEEGWKGFWKITPVSLDTFKKWLYDGCKQRKPFYQYVEIIRSNKKNKMKKTISESELAEMINQALINEGVDEGWLSDKFNHFADKAAGYIDAGKKTFQNDGDTDMGMAKKYADAYSNNREKSRVLGNILTQVEKAINDGWFTGTKVSEIAKQFVWALKNTMSRSKSTVSAFNNATFGNKNTAQAETPAPQEAPAPTETGNEVSLSRKKPQYRPRTNTPLSRFNSRHGLRGNSGFGFRGVSESKIDDIIKNVINENINK